MLEVNELEKLVTYYNDGKLAHAYLITTNNIEKCQKVLLNVIKKIFCSENNYQPDCNKCSLCHLIDIANLPSLKIIEPDGSMIKKDQILELKSLFSKSSLYTKENVYIIKNAEKMNKESANTMLKFLEEPDGFIIGFFITNNIDGVMLTIQSRCQHINVTFDSNIKENLGLQEEEFNKYYEIAQNYLEKIENEQKELILYNKTFLKEFEKKEIIYIFKIILDICEARLIKHIKEEKTHELSSLSVEKKKISLIIEFLKRITYNVNVDLLLDWFVLEMDGLNNESL